MIYLALGSNLGDRLANLEHARYALAPQFSVKQSSPIYETEPWGYQDQPPFLNQVLGGVSTLSASDLLTHIKAIEIALGREDTFRYGPRLIDIDILLFDDRVVDKSGLTIPHPRLEERPFVLVPLSDLAPDLAHPQHGRSVREMLAAMHGVPEQYRRYGENPELYASELMLGGRRFQWGTRTYLMGIVNVTPDSFSGDGILQQQDPVSTALRQAKLFVEAGADFIDVGGQSTRPGSEQIDPQAEIERIGPVVEALSGELDTVISIDTFHRQVAEFALDHGAQMVNDVWGLRADPEMAALVAERQVPVIIMHNRLTPQSAELAERLGGRYVGVEYGDLLGDIRSELLASVTLAHKAGIPDRHIILDPGLGFGKTVAQNLELLDRTDRIRDLGYPVLLGPSRKSFIGYTLDLPPDQRLEGTAAAVAIGIARGADIVRVHDVDAMARVARMADAIIRRNM